MTDNLTQNNVNAALLNRDYTLIIDRSGSMGTAMPNGKSRWTAAAEATSALARKVSEFDPDGITLYIFANHFKRTEQVKPDAVDGIFATQEPNGGTNLADVLKDAFNNYFSRKSAGKAQPNGESFFVITDGTPDDQSAVARVIKDATLKVGSASELSVTFIQVGNDSSAATYLKRLDDDLEKEGAKYDIVDTITMDEMGDRSLTAVVTDAILEHKQHAA